MAAGSYLLVKLAGDIGGYGLHTGANSTVVSYGTVGPTASAAGTVGSGSTTSNQVVQGVDGGGGVGGLTGVTMYSDLLVNHGVINGGTGGKGGPAAFNASTSNATYTAIGGYGGYGGAGGAGISMTGGTVTNTGTVTGGTGGAGGVGGAGAAPGAYSYGGEGGRGGNGGAGVVLSGSTMTNTASISGGAGGGGAAGGPGFIPGDQGYDGNGGVGVIIGSASMLTNSGHVTGGVSTFVEGDGVVMTGGRLVNQTGGAISGYNGVVNGSAGAAVTVVNAGRITGYYSVELKTGLDRLIAQSGAYFGGEAIGRGSATLELASGAGTVSNLGANTQISGDISGSFHGFATYYIDAGSSWTFTGTGQVYGGVKLFDAGTANVAGTLNLASAGVYAQVTGSLINTGTINVGGGAGDFARLVFVGDQALSGSGVVNLHGYAAIGAKDGSTLTSFNTIQGSGSLHVGAGLTVASGGRIDATGTIFVNGAGGTLTNDGLVETSSSGVLLMNNLTLDDQTSGGLVVGHLLKLSSANVVGGSMTIVGGGEIEAAAGSVTIDPVSGFLNNYGDLISSNASLTLVGHVNGSGQMRLVGSGDLTVEGPSGEQAIFVGGATGTLSIGTGFTGRIVGFSHSGGNKLDLMGVVATSYKFEGTASGGNLLLYNGRTLFGRIKLAGDFTASTFNLATDGNGGTVITDPAKGAAPLAQAAAGLGSGASSQAAQAAPPWARASALTLTAPFA